MYEDIPRVDINASLLDWDDAFGVTNRLVFPVAGATQAPFPRNVTIAVPFGAVRVGEDEMVSGSCRPYARTHNVTNATSVSCCVLAD